MSKTTENYGLTKPEVGEFFSLETWNENMDKIDGELKKREDAQKESDNSLMNPEFTEAKERKNLTSGEKIHLMLGKISKFFSDMKAIAFSGSYNDLVDKPKIPTVLNNQTTTEEGYALDARQANPNIDGTLAKQVADLNGSLTALSHYSITRIHDFRLRDQESKTVVLQDGVYIFINGHINASQITLLKVLNSWGVKTTDIIAPTSTHEVTISGSNNTVAFSANGLCYGYIFYLFPFE